MSHLLQVKDLGVTLDGETILHDLNFELNVGEALAVIGPNGAGKSVLLHALLGMVPHTGEITWSSEARIGYVPQKIDADRHLPINFRNLLTAKAAILGLPQTEIDSVIKTVGLDEKNLATPVGHLSGGQFQRALIAFALLGNPTVLILDEPTASIDKPGEEQVYELIHRLQNKYQMTVILVSHDLNFVYRYAKKVLCLNKYGLCFGAPDEALTPELIQKLYGGPTKHYHHMHNAPQK